MGKDSYQIAETKDIMLIKSILAKDNFYTIFEYDGGPNLSELVIDTISSMWFVLYYIDTNVSPTICSLAGLIKVDKITNVLAYPHVLIYPQFRGKDSIEWGLKVIESLREKGFKSGITFTPYVPAKEYAERMGFKLVTVIKNGLLKDGKLLDQFVLEYSE